MRVDEEQGLQRGGHGATSAHQQAEMHEAEESPLVWNNVKKAWVSADDFEADDEGTAVQPSSSSADSPNGSHVPIPGAGRKPVRAISAISDGEPIYVAFEDEDPDNPFEWSRKKKWIMTGIGSWLTTLGEFVCLAGSIRIPGRAHPLTDRLSFCFCSGYRWSRLRSRYSKYASGTRPLAHHGFPGFLSLPSGLWTGSTGSCTNI